MRKAEDFVFGQEENDRTDAAQAQAQTVREFQHELAPLLPLVIQTLEARNYPDVHGVFMRKTLTVDGVRRVGWTVYSGYESDDSIHLLSDGTFAIKGYDSTILAIEQIPWRDRHTQVLEQIRRMISYR